MHDSSIQSQVWGFCELKTFRQNGTVITAGDTPRAVTFHLLAVFSWFGQHCLGMCIVTVTKGASGCPWQLTQCKGCSGWCRAEGYRPWNMNEDTIAMVAFFFRLQFSSSQFFFFKLLLYVCDRACACAGNRETGTCHSSLWNPQGITDVGFLFLWLDLLIVDIYSWDLASACGWERWWWEGKGRTEKGDFNLPPVRDNTLLFGGFVRHCKFGR